jgi:uncharacterized damage-inducible protein DinB
MNPHLYQYNLVTSSRAVVFDFCETFRTGDYTRGITFDGKSIGQLQVHVANTYLGWLVITAGKKQASYFRDADYADVAAVRLLFDRINTIVYEFISSKESCWQHEELHSVKNTPVRITPAQLFTHVITHEFHHKGQILMLARHMGARLTGIPESVAGLPDRF